MPIKNAEYKNVKYIKNQMLPQHQKEFVSFIEWQIAQKIFDINGKYVSHEDLTFNIFFWNLYKINETALHWATRKGHSEVTKVLLKQKGIDINAKDIYLFYLMIILII